MTFSGLLNAIDGVGGVSRGVIIVMTTNHVNRIDSALCRPGRIDRSFLIGTVNADSARRMFLRFYPDANQAADNFARSVISDGHAAVTPAELQDHFVKHRKDEATAAAVFTPKQRVGGDSHDAVFFS